MNNRLSVSYEDKKIISKLSNHLYNLICNIDKPYKDIIFICIGTDRSTGDSLAPIIGYKLYKKHNIYGTIHDTVNAKNLHETIKDIDTDNNLIIAIDAGLGKYEDIGNIVVRYGSVKPGSGVGKDLESVGDISIVGMVNFGGFHDFLILQNTRLSLVMNMAEKITKVINKTMNKLSKRNIREIA